jgi:hypothetical protein
VSFILPADERQWTFQEREVHREQPCTQLGLGEQNWGSYLAIVGKGCLDLRESTNILPVTLMATLLLSIAYSLRLREGQFVSSELKCCQQNKMETERAPRRQG